MSSDRAELAIVIFPSLPSTLLPSRPPQPSYESIPPLPVPSSSQLLAKRPIRISQGGGTAGWNRWCIPAAKRASVSHGLVSAQDNKMRIRPSFLGLPREFAGGKAPRRDGVPVTNLKGLVTRSSSDMLGEFVVQSLGDRGGFNGGWWAAAGKTSAGLIDGCRRQEWSELGRGEVR